MEELTLPKTACMVFYDDECGGIWPLGWNHDCEGALDSYGVPVVFPDRKAAHVAIDISRKHAALRKAQGKVFNSDFVRDGKNHIRVRGVQGAVKGGSRG